METLPIQRWILPLGAFAAFLMAWLTPLSFVPVPWPDDSAFYFVAHELFKWPPRWVMLPQAPFEPTYTEWNFNTMPLYPILIGLGRLVGIDGSHGLKIWPLGFWALSGALMGTVLRKRGLSPVWVTVWMAAFYLDPSARWASTLVRPESLIGLAGLTLVLGLTFGWPKKWAARKLWDPEAALLALSAAAHFNAIHLLFPVVVAHVRTPKRLWDVGWRTALYLSPWIFTVLLKPQLFWHQMTTQWTRLAVPNGWLSGGFEHFLRELFQSMGTPVPFAWSVLPAAAILLVIALAAFWLLVRDLKSPPLRTFSLAPAGAWVAGSIWLWHTKPEVWFTYFLHLSLFTWVGLALFRWQPPLAFAHALRVGLVGLFLFCGHATLSLGIELSRGTSWSWDTYRQFIGCIDRALVTARQRHPETATFRVWDPTFPDVTIELSRRHPDWSFSRTNDFWERRHLALKHAREVEAMVVPETINGIERWIDGPQAMYPEVQSVWMNWREYFLFPLLAEPLWKPHRHLCQAGRWQAFIYSR